MKTNGSRTDYRWDGQQSRELVHGLGDSVNVCSLHDIVLVPRHWKQHCLGFSG